jgi:predicted O-methyltransferase YrrM
MKRKSLPGVDELFGPSEQRGDRAAPVSPDEGRAAAPTAAERAEVTEAHAVLRQMAANEGAALRTAREAAQAFPLPSPEVGALLRWAVTASHARAVVEIGSACGISGLWMLQAMPDGVLTSLEPDEEAQQLAAAAFAGFASGSRVRTIHGDASTVLERLADASYDLVLLQADHRRFPEHLASARRLLRPGGMVIALGIVPVGEHAAALQRFLHDLVEDPAFSTTVLPIDDGVALANHHAATP